MNILRKAEGAICSVGSENKPIILLCTSLTVPVLIGYRMVSMHAVLVIKAESTLTHPQI